jgi:single-stranded-DNA-specific exonuclease
MTKWMDRPSPQRASLEGHFPPLIESILIQRGITSTAEAQAYIDPRSYTPAPASDLPGIARAVERIIKAIQTGELIGVWGDFDVDGQTSTTLLVQVLSALGAKVIYHIPIRAKESHGVHIEHLSKMIDDGATLIVTCDTGITAHKAVDYARSRSVDFVITDHHDLGETLPNAYAVVNPKRLNESHPLYTLAGVGVAHKLAEMLSENLRFTIYDLRLSDLLDLVALGLVADVALLTKDTRYLVQCGLEALRNTQRLGLKRMMQLAELNPLHLNEEHIGFGIAPRLNAIGRLGDANPIVELLLSNDPMRVNVLAAQLEGLNAQRKFLCDQVTRAAEKQIQDDPRLIENPIIVLHGSEWLGGVIGIVASRIVDRYQKPAILLTGSPETGLRGSARSVEGLHITEAIAAQRDLLTNFGGHPMAAGLGLPFDNLDAFKRNLFRTAETMLGEAVREEPEITIDAWFPLADLTLDLAAQINMLAPFGAGNPRLKLASRNVTLKNFRSIGKSGDHLRLTIQDQADNLQTVLWWDGGNEALPDAIVNGAKFDIAYTLRASDYRGQMQLNLEFVDWRIRPEEAINVEKPKIEIVDWRDEENPQSLMPTINLSTLVWAEGGDRKTIKGAMRHELTQADTLVIWSAPPAPDVLREALAIVQPKKIIVVSKAQEQNVRLFLETLAGLIKSVLNTKNGETSVSQLAGLTGQRISAVIRGLEWLSAHGDIAIDWGGDDQIRLRVGKKFSDKALEDLALNQIKWIIAETNAYRANFRKMNLDF